MVLKKYWNGVARLIEEKELGPLYEERERLMEICVPYKIQSCERGYLNKQEVIMSRKRLIEIDREIERRIR